MVMIMNMDVVIRDMYSACHWLVGVLIYTSEELKLCAAAVIITALLTFWSTLPISCRRLYGDGHKATV